MLFKRLLKETLILIIVIFLLLLNNSLQLGLLVHQTSLCMTRYHRDDNVLEDSINKKYIYFELQPE